MNPSPDSECHQEEGFILTGRPPLRPGRAVRVAGRVLRPVANAAMRRLGYSCRLAACCLGAGGAV